MAFLGYSFFIIASLTLLFINYKLQKTLFTPSSYLIIAYLFVCTLQILGSVTLGYAYATVDLWCIILAFLIVAMLADYWGRKFANGLTLNGDKLQKNRPNRLFIKDKKRIDVICCIAVIYSLVHFMGLLAQYPNVFYIVQTSFQERYSDTGGMFYIRLLLMIATAYYWGCADFSKKSAIMGMICLIPNLLSFVKGIIFIPCLASLLLRLKNGEIKLSIKSVLYIILTGIIIFFAVYLTEISIYNTELLWKLETYQTIYSKLLNYLIAGIQSFNQNLLSTHIVSLFRSGDNITLAPFINLCAKFGIGKSIGNVCEIWQVFGYSEGAKVTSNVNTYIGTLYLYNGIVVGELLNFFRIFIASFIGGVFSHRRDFCESLSGLYSAGIALGWFEYYFVHTFWAYLFAIALIFTIACKFRIKK